MDSFSRHLVGITALNSALDLIFSISPTLSLIIGIVMTVLGSAAMSAGNIMMKLGIHRESLRRNQIVDYPFYSAMWWLGFTSYSLGSAIHVAALAFAPASILAPMNSLGLILNALVAATVLEEKIGISEAVATCGTMLGVTTCAIASFLPHKEETHPVSGIDSWTDAWYLAYVGVCVVCALGCLIALNIEEFYMNQKRLDEEYERFLEKSYIQMTSLDHPLSDESLPLPVLETSTTASQSSGGGGQEFARGGGRDFSNNSAELSSTDPLPQIPEERGLQTSVSTLKPRTKYRTTTGMMYGFLAGVIGSQCVLEIKELVAIVKYGIAHSEIWWTVQPYLVAFASAMAIMLQVHFLNFGLSRGEATLVVPTYYVSWTIFGTLGGFAKFKEMAGCGPLPIALFGCGLVTTLLCIGFMAVREMIAIKEETDRYIPEIMPDSAADEEVQDHYRHLSMGIPMAIGFAVIPVGRLAGRPDIDVRKHTGQEGVRRTQSDIARHRMEADTLLPQSMSRGSRPAAYNWTLSGDIVPPAIHENFQNRRLEPTRKKRPSLEEWHADHPGASRGKKRTDI